jgi:hypothetical protein
MAYYCYSVSALLKCGVNLNPKSIIFSEFQECKA